MKNNERLLSTSKEPKDFQLTASIADLLHAASELYMLTLHSEHEQLLANSQKQQPPSRKKSRESEYAESSFELFLTDINAEQRTKRGLLNHEQEIWLSQVRELGELAELIMNVQGYEAVTEGASQFLHMLTEKAEAAKECLSLSNTRLVISVARKYQDRGLPLLDLIQEGNIGLLKAVNKFNWRRDLRFSTYATWWIRQAVLRSIENDSRTVRLPSYVSNTVNRVQHQYFALATKNGEYPSNAQIAEVLDIPEEHVAESWRVGSMQPSSLNALLSDSEDSEESIDLVADEETPFIDVIAHNTILAELQQICSTLNEREVAIIQKRMMGEETHKQVGAEFGISRERIRQIEKALKVKLREHFEGLGFSTEN